MVRQWLHEDALSTALDFIFLILNTVHGVQHIHRNHSLIHTTKFMDLKGECL